MLDRLSSAPAHAGAELQHFIEQHPRLFVLTGAGCSTESGIPDYRDAGGGWKRAQPMNYQDFMADAYNRQRYWARSFRGWYLMRRCQPNIAHRALARLQRCGRVEQLVTQNVDGLHQAAGSTEVIDLHGQLDRVRCMGCERRLPRELLQEQLSELNPTFEALLARDAPDGDADLEGADYASFRVPSCAHCAGILKPDVVFFGESVPAHRVEAAMQHLLRSDAMLVVGSSLMVYSGYRFARAAAESGKPIAAVNLGATRADAMLTLKVTQPCGPVLGRLQIATPCTRC